MLHVSYWAKPETHHAFRWAKLKQASKNYYTGSLTLTLSSGHPTKGNEQTLEIIIDSTTLATLTALLEGLPKE